MSSPRSRGLDVLRAVAVGLVLCCHLPAPTGTGPLTRRIVLALIRGGWTGVDLFFVVSGFLVSGLLFREYQKTGTLNATRFLLRRGFRIYPPFWLLIGTTAAYILIAGQPFHVKRVGVELLFLQSYFYAGTLWPQMWSLAVEEHFYLLLVPICLWLVRRQRDRPFDAIPWIFATLAIVCLASRILTRSFGPDDAREALFETHNRIDSLFAGVYLAYLYHFVPDTFRRWTSRHRRALALLGAAVYVPPFLFPVDHSDVLLTVGLSALAVGAACLVSASVAMDAHPSRILDGIAYIGSHSYSIYLWQTPVAAWILPHLGSTVGAHWGLRAFLFVAIAVAWGVGLSILIERPVLRLRDHLFPSLSAPLVVAPTRARLARTS